MMLVIFAVSGHVHVAVDGGLSGVIGSWGGRKADSVVDHSVGCAVGNCVSADIACNGPNPNVSVESKEGE